MARGWSSAPLLAGLFAAACGIPPPSSPQKLDVYLYEDTRQLVESVDSAAGLLETRGATAAFAEFGRPGSREQRSAAARVPPDVERERPAQAVLRQVHVCGSVTR